MGNRISQRKAELEIFSVSIGMVVIDEIRFPSRPPMIDVAGGSATYGMRTPGFFGHYTICAGQLTTKYLSATLGYRLYCSHTHSGEIGCVVLAGKDFPNAIMSELESWKLSLLIVPFSDKLSARGLLEYEDDTLGPKSFRYTTPPLKASPAHLIGSPLLSSKAFHLLATPQEILEHIPELIRLRGRSGIYEQPYIVWEPFPAACTTDNRRLFLEACKLVHVFSPNHHEMASLFEDKPQERFIPESLEKYAFVFAQHLGHHTSEQGAVLVRAGKHGSLTTIGPMKARWLPAFYHDPSPRIVDPTGAGNTFLGSFLAGWYCKHDVEEASLWGNVAASFALEQIGLPFLRTERGQELWNETSVLDRLQEYKSHIEH